LAGAFSSNLPASLPPSLALSGVPPFLTVDLIGGFHTGSALQRTPIHGVAEPAGGGRVRLAI
jgi:hypothetical protein